MEDAGIAAIVRPLSLALALLMGAFAFVLGCVGAILFLVNSDCSAGGYYGCEVYPLAGMLALAVVCLLLILVAAGVFVFFCHRDWDSVD